MHLGDDRREMNPGDGGTCVSEESPTLSQVVQVVLRWLCRAGCGGSIRQLTYLNIWSWCLFAGGHRI